MKQIAFYINKFSNPFNEKNTPQEHKKLINSKLFSTQDLAITKRLTVGKGQGYDINLNIQGVKSTFRNQGEFIIKYNEKNKKYEFSYKNKSGAAVYCTESKSNKLKQIPNKYSFTPNKRFFFGLKQPSDIKTTTCAEIEMMNWNGSLAITTLRRNKGALKINLQGKDKYARQIDEKHLKLSYPPGVELKKTTDGRILLEPHKKTTKPIQNNLQIPLKNTEYGQFIIKRKMFSNKLVFIKNAQNDVYYYPYDRQHRIKKITAKEQVIQNADTLILEKDGKEYYQVWIRLEN